MHSQRLCSYLHLSVAECAVPSRFRRPYGITPTRLKLGRLVNFSQCIQIANALPTILIDTKECSADLLTYTITYTGTDVTVTNSGTGTTSGNTITGITSGETITLTIVDNTTGCESSLEVVSPDCNCAVVNAPIGTDAAICVGETPLPILSVTVEAGETADWYDAGGVILAGGTGVTDYQMTEDLVGVYTYNVETRNISTGCWRGKTTACPRCL